MTGSKYCGILISKQTIVVLYKTERKCHIINIAVPGDKRIELKEQEKIDSYIELRQEVKKIWSLLQVVIVPVVTYKLVSKTY